ncbi:MAG: Gp138 family membrane-puncturing spike protein [Sulfuricella sp.]
MDRRERFFEPEEIQRISQESLQSKLWTALPGIVQSFDPAKNTVSVQVAISFNARLPDGSIKPISIPPLLDCPVLWQGGGGCTLTFPIKAGDECLVVFASRCIDAWWQSGGVQPQAEFRMHDLSDGFAMVGVRSVPRALSVNTSAVQLRSDDGAACVEINPTSHKIKVQTSGDIEAISGGSIKATASSSVTIDAPTITLKGNIILDGPITQTNTAGGSATATMIGPLNVTNDVTAGGKSLKTHVHSGVTAGGANTAPPV